MENLTWRTRRGEPVVEKVPRFSVVSLAPLWAHEYNPRMRSSLSRRDFLHVAGAGAVASWAPPTANEYRASQSSSQTPTAPSEAPAGWFDRPMRWVQLTLVENDPGRFDPQFWLDYFRRLHADAATLSAGGIVAYYPTNVPLHHRSAWLGESDPFGTLVAGCRGLGMHVVARTDPHAVRDEVRKAHPDWIAVASNQRTASSLGKSRLVGHLRPWPVQLRVHGSRASRDRDDVQSRWDLRQPLGAAGRQLLLRSLSEELPDGNRPRAPTHHRCARSRATRLSRVAQSAIDRAVEPLGCDDSRRQSGGALHSQRPTRLQERR